MDRWGDLNMTQRNELIKLYLNNGISSLDKMKEHYNSYQDGGRVDNNPDKDPVLKDRKPKANFYQRLLNPFRQTVSNWENRINGRNDVATHKLSWATDDDGNAIVYPDVQEINGKLYDFTDPRNKESRRAALDRAIQTGDTIMMTPEQANFWTQHYKEFYPSFDYATGGYLYEDGGPDGSKEDEKKDNPLDLGPNSFAMRQIGNWLNSRPMSRLENVDTKLRWGLTPQQQTFKKEYDRLQAEAAKAEEERRAQARQQADEKLRADLSGKNGFWTMVGAGLTRAGDPLTSGSPSIIADDANRLDEVGLEDEASRLRGISTGIGVLGLGMYTPFSFNLLRRQLLRPFETGIGIAGAVGTDKLINATTDYSSWGDMLNKGVFGSTNPISKFALELTNPFGFLGGAYGHSVDKKLAESIVRFGEPIKHVANNFLYNARGNSIPKAAVETVKDFTSRLDGSKKSIANYIFNPFIKSDYKYGIPAFTYSGAKQSDEVGAIRPFIGDPVDVFFGHSRFGNYRRIEVPRKYIQWAENKGLNSKKIKAYDLQEVSPLTVTSGRDGVSSEGLLPVRRSLDKIRINDRGSRILEDSRGIAITSQKPILDPGGFNFDYQIGDTKFYSDIWKYNGLDGFNRYIMKEPSAKYIKPLVTYFGDFIDTQGSPFVTTFFTNPLNNGTLIRK